MLVTRTQAAVKYCPLKFASGMEPKVCESINCMAWKKDQPVPTTREEMGYCGLAGEPSRVDRT